MRRQQRVTFAKTYGKNAKRPPPLSRPKCARPDFIVFCERKLHFRFQCGDENVSYCQKHGKHAKNWMNASSLLQLRLKCCFVAPSLRNCCSRSSLRNWPKRSGHSHFLYSCLGRGLETTNLTKTLCFYSKNWLRGSKARAV